MVSKAELVKRVETQLEAAFPGSPQNTKFRTRHWRVGVIQADIELKGRLAFRKGEHVLFEVVSWSFELPVQAFSFTNNIDTGLFFNDIREAEPRDNPDLTHFDFSSIPDVDVNELLALQGRLIYTDVLNAKSILASSNGAGIPLRNKNGEELVKAGLRRGYIPEDDVIAFEYEGHDGIPCLGGQTQQVRLVDLLGAKPLDGKSWVLENGKILRLQ